MKKKKDTNKLKALKICIGCGSPDIKLTLNHEVFDVSTETDIITDAVLCNTCNAIITIENGKLVRQYAFNFVEKYNWVKQVSDQELSTNKKVHELTTSPN